MRNGLRLYKQGTFIYKQGGLQQECRTDWLQTKGVSVKRGCLGKDRSVAPGNYRVGTRSAKTENIAAMIVSRAKHIQLPNLVPSSESDIVLPPPEKHGRGSI